LSSVSWPIAARFATSLNGLYRFDDIPPSRYDQFYEALARVGGDAHLTGDAVLALHELALVIPRQVRVGTSRRVRAALPAWIKIVRESADLDDLTRYELRSKIDRRVLAGREDVLVGVGLTKPLHSNDGREHHPRSLRAEAGCRG